MTFPNTNIRKKSVFLPAIFPCENWQCISKNILIKLPSTWIIHHSQVCVILLKSPKCDRNNNIGQARVHNTQLFKIKFGRGSPVWNFKVYIILRMLVSTWFLSYPIFYYILCIKKKELNYCIRHMQIRNTPAKVQVKTFPRFFLKTPNLDFEVLLHG